MIQTHGTVSGLIAALQHMPQDALVGTVHDSAVRRFPDVVYESVCGVVVLSEFGEQISPGCDRPKDAPTQAQEPWWKVPYRDHFEDGSGSQVSEG